MTQFPPLVTTLSTIDVNGKRIARPCSVYSNYLEVGIDWFFTRCDPLWKTHRVHLLCVDTDPVIEMNGIIAQSPRARCLTLRGVGCKFRSRLDVAWVGVSSYITIDCPISLDPSIASGCEPNESGVGTTRIIEIRHRDVPHAAIVYLAPTHLVMRTRDIVTPIPACTRNLYVDVIGAPPPGIGKRSGRPFESLVIGADSVRSGWMGVGFRSKAITLILPPRIPFASLLAFAALVRANPASSIELWVHTPLTDLRTIRILVRTFVQHRVEGGTLTILGDVDGQLGLDLVRLIGYATHITRTHEHPVFAFVDSAGVNWANVPVAGDSPRIVGSTFENIGVEVRVHTSGERVCVSWVSHMGYDRTQQTSEE